MAETFVFPGKILSWRVNEGQDGFTDDLEITLFEIFGTTFMRHDYFSFLSPNSDFFAHQLLRLTES